MPQQQGLKPIELEGSSKIFIRFSYLMAWTIFDGHWWWLIPRTILIGYAKKTMLLEAIAGYVTISPIWCYQQWEES